MSQHRSACKTAVLGVRTVREGVATSRSRGPGCYRRNKILKVIPAFWCKFSQKINAYTGGYAKAGQLAFRPGIRLLGPSPRTRDKGAIKRDVPAKTGRVATLD